MTNRIYDQKSVYRCPVILSLNSQLKFERKNIFFTKRINRFTYLLLHNCISLLSVNICGHVPFTKIYRVYNSNIVRMPFDDLKQVENNIIDTPWYETWQSY